ncbi:MAG TPA: hypothetical protein VGB99_14015 [Acidobacteriota bacterium]
MAGSIIDQLGALQHQLKRLVEEVGEVRVDPPPEPRRLGELSGLWRDCGPLRPIDLDETRIRAGSES